MLMAELTDRNPGFSFAEDTDDLFVGKTLLHGDVLMWLMKTLLTSWCINQRGADQHGLRTMACGALGESGLWSEDAIERLLSHSERNNFRAAYMHTSEHLDERRLMVQWWRFI